MIIFRLSSCNIVLCGKKNIVIEVCFFVMYCGKSRFFLKELWEDQNYKIYVKDIELVKLLLIWGLKVLLVFLIYLVIVIKQL